ncbi:hypothetical protein Tco_0464691 [Tanacetum coccineum]
MSFDDLYNKFKIVEQEVKGTASSSSSSSSSSQNMAFVSSPSSTNEVNTAYGVSTANTQVSPTSTQVSTASTQVSTANLSDDIVYAFFASQPNGSQLVYEDLEQIHEDDIEEMDLKWQLALLSMRTRRGPRNQDSRNRNQDSSRRTINMEETSFKAMVAIDRAGFDWSYMVDDEVPTNMALMDFLDSKISPFKHSEISMLKSEIEKLKQEKERNQLKIEIFIMHQEVPDKLIGSQITDNSRKGVGSNAEFEVYRPKTSKSVSENISNEVSESSDAPLIEELVLDDKLVKKTVFPTVSKIEYAHCNYHQRERVVSRNNHTRVNYNYYAKKAHPSAHRNMAPRVVLMKAGLRPLNTARLVYIAHPETIVYSARPMLRFSKSAQSTGHPQQEEQGYVDSGCSRYMTGTCPIS